MTGWSWKRWQAAFYAGSLWRLAGCRATLIEVADLWRADLPDPALAAIAELERHVRAEWRRLHPE